MKIFDILFWVDIFLMAALVISILSGPDEAFVSANLFILVCFVTIMNLKELGKFGNEEESLVLPFDHDKATWDYCPCCGRKMEKNEVER